MKRRELYNKATVLVLCLTMTIAAVTGCKEETNDLDVDAPLSINTAVLYNKQSSSYDEKAEKRRQDILNMKDTLTPSEKGKTYYISEKGNDKNDGLSKKTAWRSVARAEMSSSDMEPGDVVLLERGGLYRGTITIRSGVSYGAYGSGCKPTIYGSLRDYAYPKLWHKTDKKNIWKIEVGDMSDIGNLVFNHGEKCAIKKLDDKMHGDGEFYHDRANGDLYLYMSKGNPGDVYYDIEICSNDHIMEGFGNVHDVYIENLCLKYTGAHAICFRNGSKNITVKGCEIGYIGGSMLTGMNVRYGNGFEVVDNTENITVTDNWVYQCFDAGITHQSSYEPGCVQKKINFSNNLIEYCNYNIEYYVSVSNGVIEDTVYENNILRFAGYGFGSINRIGSNTTAAGNISNYNRIMPSKNFVIRNNIMDSPLYWQYCIGYPNAKDNTGPVITGNTYIQKEDEFAMYMIGGKIQKSLYTKNQKELELAVLKVDSKPASVKFEK